MNKKILAVAIATAMAAPFAMADEGSVTISGNVGASVTSMSTSGYFYHEESGEDSATFGSFNNRASDVSPGGSDLTISGFENLGNGLKAVFLLKSWLNVTGNYAQGDGIVKWLGGVDTKGGPGALLFGRNKDAYVGLQGNFGTVALGAHGQPYKTATGGLELFGDTVGDARGSVTNGQGAFHSGIGDAVIWFLPNMNGFSGHVQVGSENGVDGGASASGAQFNYSNGPLYMTYAHANNDSGLKGNKVGVGYSFGDTKINGVVERTKADGSDGITAYSLGLAQTFGANTFKIQYARNDSDGTTYSGIDTSNPSLWAVGLDHALSKRTTLYALYADGKNLVNTSLNVNIDSFGDTSYIDYRETKMDNAFEVGINHSF